MTLWTAADAAAATGGRVTTDWAAEGLSIDSRTIAPGELFVALTDARDGHDFVADALAKGAAAAMVTRRPEGVAADAPLLVVDDVLEGLRALARAARARAPAQVIGITGSVGKTSTKEMLRAILAPQGPTHAAERSYNNHWGVPLTLARMPADTRFAVVEIGMNRPGEIAPLARLAQLDVAMVTTVAPAHLEAFDSVAGIAREKASIMDGLRPGGTAILHADVETAPILLDKAAAVGARLVRFGETGEEAQLLESFLDHGRTVARARLRLGGAERDLPFKLDTPGRHFAMNGLAALVAAVAVGADLGRAAGDLGRWQPYEGRGNRRTVIVDPVEELGFELVDDAYNANPASVSAALEMLAASTPKDDIGHIARGRRIAILGDMLELGPTEMQLHADLAAHPAVDRLDRIHCVGPRARALWEALPPPRRGHWEADAPAMAARARGLVDAGDIVLVKGSLGIGLSRVVDALAKLGQSAAKDS